DENGVVAMRRPLQPLYELWEDAIAMAEFDSSRLWGDYGYDEERGDWWAGDSRGRVYRFVVGGGAAAGAAAWGPSNSVVDVFDQQFVTFGVLAWFKIANSRCRPRWTRFSIVCRRR